MEAEKGGTLDEVERAILDERVRVATAWLEAFALRERVARLSQFHHPDFTHIKKVDRLNDERGTVALMSDGVKGFRLSEILTDTERLAPPPDVGATLYVVNQLAAAIAGLPEPGAASLPDSDAETDAVPARGRSRAAECADLEGHGRQQEL